jgi:histidinol-phosphate/aromatic aminotransferase/cobyric acid decarboxylase-like protein
MQLKEPLQLKLMKAHTQLQSRAFPVGPEHVVAATEFVRTPWSIESLSKTFGLSAANIRKTIDSVGREIQNLKNRVTKRRKRKKPGKGK